MFRIGLIISVLIVDFIMYFGPYFSLLIYLALIFFFILGVNTINIYIYIT